MRARKLPVIPPEIRAFVGLAAIEVERYPRVCGIYFLCRDGQLTYVGQSVDVFTRIASHRATKDFDSAFMIECQEHELSVLEGAIIRHLQPKENGRYPGKKSTVYGPYVSDDRICEVIEKLTFGASAKEVAASISKKFRSEEKLKVALNGMAHEVLGQ